MSEINHMRDSLAQRISRRLANETLLNAFRMDEARMRSYLEVMRRSPARYLMAYVEAAAQLARFSRETGIEVRPLKGLAACAGTVTEETRTLLEQTFRCRVHNKYGSRECTDMACECDHGGMHVYTNHVVLEIVDEAGEPVPAGSVGRILVTLLGNFSFPIIRYEIGDLGACREGACACGSPFPMLDRVVGRSAEVVRTPSGAQVLPVFIRHLIGVVHNPGIVRRFQFIQNSLTDCDLYLEVAASVPDTGYKPVVDRLQRDLAVVLGEDCVVRPQRVEHIPESANGKFQYVISRVAANPSRS
jgi:phenylacetate-CoA ligase